MNISLNYNKDNMYRTPFGGIVTIVLICILALLFFNNVTNYYHSYNLALSYHTSYSIQEILLKIIFIFNNKIDIHSL